MTRSSSAPRPDATDDVVIDDEMASRLRLALMRLSRRLRQESPPGVTPSQLSALASIDRHGPLTIGELAAHENVQPPTISRIVGALEGEGWIERVPDPDDRRVALIRSTPKAHRELDRIRSERNASLARRLARLSTEDLTSVLTAVPALERLLEDQP